MAIYKGNTKIVKLYKGAIEIVRRYKGTNLIYQNSLLPSGYILLDYIENPDQNAFINTGIVPDDTTGFKVNMSVKDITTDLYYLGCRESTQTDSRFGLGVYQGHTYMAFGSYYSDPNNWTITRDTPFVAENNYKNSRVATMGGLYPVSVGSLSGITFTRNIYLFKSNQSTLQITDSCRIYDCEITKGTTVVAHFIPCLDNNGVACMYDVVRKQTFYSAGSSDFITNYVPPITIPSGYTLLEYLESDGTGQYINTGYIATQNTNIECDFMVQQHNSNLLNYVYGEYTSGKACGIYVSSTTNVYGVLYGSADRNTSIPRVFNEKVHSILNSAELIINGTTESVGGGTFTATNTLYLFRGNGSSRPGMIGRIYYMLIREARSVVSRYLVPCLDTNSVPCMYDVLTHQTFYNAGTGDLGYGLPIPSNYTELSYIESTGTQFIDTGFTPNQNTKVELTLQKETGSASNIFGSRISSQSQAFTFQISSGDYQFISGYGSRTERSNVVNDGQVHTLMRDKGDFYIDGVLKVSQTSPDFTCPGNAYLFTMYNNAKPTSGTSVKVYSCKIWDNGTLHNYFVPCLDANNVPCLFDKITGNTYYNAGTGEFTYREKLPDEYMECAYIESSGTQYIDTGYYATNTSGINIDYAYSSSGSAGLCGIYQGQIPRTDTLFVTTHSGNTSGIMNLISQGNSITNNIAPTIGTKYNAKINYLNDGKLILNYTTTGNNGSNGVVSTRTIKLFCRDSGGSLAYTNARIYMCQISEGTNLVRNLIPCYRKSDNAIGMYDIVNGVFYTNAGSGDFTKGDNV